MHECDTVEATVLRRVYVRSPEDSLQGPPGTECSSSGVLGETGRTTGAEDLPLQCANEMVRTES
jgi:hypothetical protein